MRHALRAAPLLLLAACGGPLLYADLEVPQVLVTLPAQRFPASVASPALWCDPSTPSCVATELEYDLAQSVSYLREPGATYQVRLTRLAIAMTAAAGGDLGGVKSAVILASPAAGGAPVEIARYTRSAADPAPTTLSVAGDPGLDLAPYVTAGRIRVRVELSYDAPTPAFDADVTADFYLKVRLDYGALL